jgi:hypothetical protein
MAMPRAMQAIMAQAVAMLYGQLFSHVGDLR